VDRFFRGNKQRLLGISQRGDAYLRTLMVHGARSAVAVWMVFA
jgi:transposase